PALQYVQRVGHAGAPYAKHHRQEPVSEWQHVAIDSVVAHERPTRQTLVDVGAAIGQGCLRGLRREGMYVAQQQAIEGLASLNRTQKRGGLNPVAGARQLDVLVMRALVRAEQKREAAHALTAIDAHLDALRVRARRHDRDDAALEEKGVLDRLVGRNDGLVDFQLERFEMRRQERKIRG